MVLYRQYVSSNDSHATEQKSPQWGDNVETAWSGYWMEDSVRHHWGPCDPDDCMGHAMVLHGVVR